MPQQPGNPLSKSAADDVVTVRNNPIKYETMRLELYRLVSGIIRLEGAIDTNIWVAEATNRNPEVDNFKSELASAKTELENFLKENNLKKVSYDTLKCEMLERKKWWQFWRSRAAADLLPRP